MAQKNGIAQADMATPGQLSEVVRQFQNAFPTKEMLEKLAAKYCSNKVNAQTLIEQAGSLKLIRGIFEDLVEIHSDPNRYRDEVIKSEYGYSSGYCKARPIKEQIEELKKHDLGRIVDWGLNQKQVELLTSEVPLKSEGIFVTVIDPTIYTHFNQDSSVDQSAAVLRVLRALSNQRNGQVHNSQGINLNSMHYRRSEKSAEKMRLLWESQGCPTGILLIPAQLGIMHRGESPCYARWNIHGSEFPLDAYEVLQMLLTHGHRIDQSEVLWIDLPGSGYFLPDSNRKDEYVLSIEFRNRDLWLHRRRINHPSGHHGSASGFLPDSNWF